jgi:hypothetical protein
MRRISKYETVQPADKTADKPAGPPTY